eukprot:TRINITY_DN6495_c3_g1_i1.p1 TRINITY_DN6495_c3_g1~~TRINITY_DN6495_c3_g1_i1.p1  ORF type:complete len:356 (+),score=69.74 TRINITY_DN6495_c3_g1_i1:72-1070(+)
MTARRLTVAIMGNTSNPLLQAYPRDLNVNFVIADTAQKLLDIPEAQDAECLLAFAMDSSWSNQLIEVFPKLPKVKWVHSFSAGIDAMAPFIHECLLKGDGANIPMTNGRGAFSSSLAEWVITAVLHFNKQIPRCIENKDNKNWDRFTMDVVKGKTIGFVGYGHISQASAEYCKTMGMRVVALRRDASKPAKFADVVFPNEQKSEMLSQCDFVVSVLPGTPDTQNFFNKEVFASMKKGCVFISIGRGVVVDEDALADAMESGHIAAASLDVFKTEPLPSESRLWDLDNLLITAHNADKTADFSELGWGIWKDNYQAYLNDAPLATLVDKVAGY